MPEQPDDLPAGQYGWEAIVVLGADLGKDFPVLMTHHAHEEELCGSGGLADGFRLPAFDGFYVKEVVTQHLFGHLAGVAMRLLVDEAQLAVIGVPGAGSIEM